MLSVYFILLSLIAAYGAFTDQENLEKNQLPYKVKQRNPQLIQPSFCFGLECPSYRLVKNYSSFELREYEESKWVSIKMPVTNMSVTASHKNVFQYIIGSNAEGANLARTIPLRVLVPLRKSAKFATMSIFLSAKLKNPPMPTNANHFLNIFPKASVYVKSFPWASKKIEYAVKATTLMEELRQLGLDFDSSFYGWYMYACPADLSLGRSEVWFLAGKNQQLVDLSGLGFY